MADQYAYHVVYVGLISGENRFGHQKVVCPMPMDNEEIIDQVAEQIKKQKHFMEVTIVNWIQLTS